MPELPPSLKRKTKDPNRGPLERLYPGLLVSGEEWRSEDADPVEDLVSRGFLHVSGANDSDIITQCGEPLRQRLETSLLPADAGSVQLSNKCNLEADARW